MGSLGGRLVDAQTTLVLDSPMDPASVEVCLDLLDCDHPTGGDVLSVLLARRPDRLVAEWERHVGELPENFAILSTQSAPELPAGVDVETVREPGDLTGIGVLITEHLAGWTEDRPGSFCLHSATVQLQYATTEQVYRFLHTLCAHLVQEGARGHVHVNPAAHDERTVDTLMTLFDAVVEVRDGDPRVRTR